MGRRQVVSPRTAGLGQHGHGEQRREQLLEHFAGSPAAAGVAEWDYVEIPFDVADPATLVKGLEEALQLKPKPTGVTFTGVDRILWGQVVEKYEEAA